MKRSDDRGVRIIARIIELAMYLYCAVRGRPILVTSGIREILLLILLMANQLDSLLQLGGGNYEALSQSECIEQSNFL